MNNWNKLDDNSRLWLYGSLRKFSDQEEEEISKKLSDFCTTWAAHGTKLDCGFKLLHNRIIALAVNEQVEPASGCSIDSSVALIREINDKFNFDLFNRLRAFVLTDGDEEIQSMSMNEIKNSIEEGDLTLTTKIINMQATQLSEILPNAFIPVKETWLKKFFTETISA